MAEKQSKKNPANKALWGVNSACSALLNALSALNELAEDGKAIEGDNRLFLASIRSRVDELKVLTAEFEKNLSKLS
jgi:hypothetical protein